MNLKYQKAPVTSHPATSRETPWLAMGGTKKLKEMKRTNSWGATEFKTSAEA